MRINEYVDKASRTNAPLQNIDQERWHMLLGMMTEVGELADPFKKNLAYGREIDWVNVREELGDLMWYIAVFCKINDFDFEDILKTNINKLETRFPEKFDRDQAINRDTTSERNILEK